MVEGLFSGGAGVVEGLFSGGSGVYWWRRVFSVV